MLERTAASLESCTLQRILPKPTKSCRRLQAAFWQHGASAIDLAGSLPGPPPLPQQDAVAELAAHAPSSSSQPVQPVLMASAIALDFLYPSTKPIPLRRVYPRLPRSDDARSGAHVQRRRQFSSTTETTTETMLEATAEDKPAMDVIKSEDQAADTLDTVKKERIADTLGSIKSEEQTTDSLGTIESTEQTADSLVTVQEEETADTLDTVKEEEAADTLDTAKEEADILDPVKEAQAAELLESLKLLLSDQPGRHYADIWELYLQLRSQVKRAVRAEVVNYLVHSHGVVEAGRALRIFRVIPVEEWDDELQSSGILLFLRDKQLKAAIRTFHEGLRSKGLTGGLEYLLADAITSRQWRVALDIWVEYFTAESEKGRKPDMERMDQLKSIPNQGSLYFAFRSFMATDGAEFESQLEESEVSKLAFRRFRRHFAELALREPCNPDQAAVILDNLQDPYLYNRYFEVMMQRLQDKLETRITINKLQKMYEHFRQVPGAKPTLKVLRGMFHIYYPKNITGLEKLYHEWISVRGKLDRWGYEKYLKLYAMRGEVDVVKKLWAEYATAHPSMLETARGFRSLVNVYAQVGNPAEAEKVLQDMIKTYRAEPDIDMYNMLLKAYVKADDYDGTLKCFGDAAKKLGPDAWTYAHVMAMTAKKGDLETTLEFFNMSQQAKVGVTKEMALSLVVAYCQNELYQEAESLCVELTQRRLTNVAVWNQLINFNGDARNIDACDRILSRMRELRVDWDEDTCRFVLQALVNADQIHAASNLLKQGEEEGMFVVTPEHYAIVMAGATRCNQFRLVDSLHLRMQKANMPVSLAAFLAVVESAAKQKPAVERTANLGKEFVERFRQALTTPRDQIGSTPADGNEAMAVQASGFRNLGRAIALLVQLRHMTTVEELVEVFNEVFPDYKETGQYPVQVVSALMRAHFQDGDADKALELWYKVWEHTLKKNRKKSGDGVFAAAEYELSPTIGTALKAFRQKEDVNGLSNCIDNLVKEGFRITNTNWNLAVRYLAELGRLERAMHWCELMLMPGWQGWTWGRTSKIRNFFRNTRSLRPQKQLIFRLQQEWLRLRQGAAWDAETSRQLSNIEEKFPRLYQAFETSDVRALQLSDSIDPARQKIRDLDEVIRTIPYDELLKAKEVLMKQLTREIQREKEMGIDRSTSKNPQQRLEWKRELQKRVRRYARTWAERREKLMQAKSESQTSSDTQTSNDSQPPSGTSTVDPDKVAAGQRMRDWDSFFDRYDQRPHGGYNDPRAAARHASRALANAQNRNPPRPGGGRETTALGLAPRYETPRKAPASFDEAMRQGRRRT